MTASNTLLLAFYGDDFTGSTDAMEFLNRAGVKTVLFIEPPTPQQLARYEGIGAIGVAGKSRSLNPVDMDKELRPAFSALKKSGARHIHYKVCSTFDSSPTVGSIGKAIDIGVEIFSSSFIPLLVAAPRLGRYCLFGNLFARMGIGSKDDIYRLDRHPSMSKHPITPADESDLRLHLSRQTSKKIGLLDILQIEEPAERVRESLKDLLHQGSDIVLFDALYESQMANIGSILEDYASHNKPLFSVGSSGIEMALGNFWEREGKLQACGNKDIPGERGPILVASGSCSPVTASQVAWAKAHGFAEIALNTTTIVRQGIARVEIQSYVAEATRTIKEGKSVILHTNCGENLEKVKSTDVTVTTSDADRETAPAGTADLFGTVLGRIVREVAQRTSLGRVVVAGGDTSSFAARAMGIEAIEMIAPLSPGAPLCKAYCPDSPVDGLEVNFKGGQVGSEDYFVMVKEGKYVP